MNSKCPRCGAALILRNGKYGMFWGCSKFPACRFTADIQYDHPDYYSHKEAEEARFEDELHGIYIASVNGD